MSFVFSRCVCVNIGLYVGLLSMNSSGKDINDFGTPYAHNEYINIDIVIKQKFNLIFRVHQFSLRLCCCGISVAFE